MWILGAGLLIGVGGRFYAWSTSLARTGRCRLAITAISMAGNSPAKAMPSGTCPKRPSLTEPYT